MPNLTALLNIGAGAIHAQQERISLTQNNIANATTPGYRRQRGNMHTLGGAVLSLELKGVTVGSTQSIDAPLLDRQLYYQYGEFGLHNTRSQVGALIEAAFNPLDGFDLGAQLSTFFSKAQNLSTNPAATTERRAMIAEAKNLALGFNRTAAHLIEARYQTSENTAASVGEINGKLERIARLDREIAVQVATEKHPGDMIDTRDQLVAELSNQIGVRVVRAADGTIQVFNQDGLALVESGRARTLSVERVSITEIRIALDTGVGPPQTMKSIGGNLGGLVSSHNDVIGEHLREVDQLAFDFSIDFNAIHQAGVGLDGVGGRDFFVPAAGVDGAASSMAVETAIVNDPTLLAVAANVGELPGGNSNLLAMLGMETAALSSGQTAHEKLASLVQLLGDKIRTDLDSSDAIGITISQLQAMQASISGVSLEEEMINLTATQRAFEAAMQVITTTDEMMQTVLNLKR